MIQIPVNTLVILVNTNEDMIQTLVKTLVNQFYTHTIISKASLLQSALSAQRQNHFSQQGFKVRYLKSTRYKDCK